MQNILLTLVPELSNIEISAGSSLLNIDHQVYLCSDDQYSIFELQNNSWVKYVWNEAPALPKTPVELKKIKPDFECLLQISENEIALIPSGSKTNRIDALIFNIKHKKFKKLNLTFFFESLHKNGVEVNLEGATKYKNSFLFLNRGVLSKPSLIISANSSNFEINQIKNITFDKWDDTPLHGSELCIFEDHLYALAVAEKSDNSYDDGAILGSAFYKISLDDFSIIERSYLDLPIKAEGLCRYKDQWLIATDPDGDGISQFFTF